MTTGGVFQWRLAKKEARLLFLEYLDIQGSVMEILVKFKNRKVTFGSVESTLSANFHN